MEFRRRWKLRDPALQEKRSGYPDQDPAQGRCQRILWRIQIREYHQALFELSAFRSKDQRQSTEPGKGSLDAIQKRFIRRGLPIFLQAVLSRS